MGEEVWEGSQCLGIVCPWSHFPHCLRITYIPHHIITPSSKFDLCWERPMCKDHPLKIYHILGSRWLDVNGGWSDCLSLHLMWFCSGEVDSKALLERKKVCVYIYSRVWCTSLFRGKSSISGKQWGDALHPHSCAHGPGRLPTAHCPPDQVPLSWKLGATCSASFFCNHSSLLLQAKRGSDPHLQHGAWAEHKRTSLCTLTWVIALP